MTDWTPREPLRADATDEQIERRIVEIALWKTEQTSGLRWISAGRIAARELVEAKANEAVWVNQCMVDGCDIIPRHCPLHAPCLACDCRGTDGNLGICEDCGGAGYVEPEDVAPAYGRLLATNARMNNQINALHVELADAKRALKENTP